jgi:hypothetical protein
MTVETCVAFCSQKGFARAALQASYMCWCLTADQVLYCIVLYCVCPAPLCVCWRAFSSALLAIACRLLCGHLLACEVVEFAPLWRCWVTGFCAHAG